MNKFQENIFKSSVLYNLFNQKILLELEKKNLLGNMNDLMPVQNSVNFFNNSQNHYDKNPNYFKFIANNQNIQNKIIKFPNSDVDNCFNNCLKKNIDLNNEVNLKLICFNY